MKCTAQVIKLSCQYGLCMLAPYSRIYPRPDIEFKDFNLGFHHCTFLCTTLKCIEIVHKTWDSVQKII